jgi:molybdate transport system ATP-binding protein
MIEVRIRKRFAAGPGSAEFTLDTEFLADQGVTVLFGPSGSGKTLTLDCTAGFAVPEAGRVVLDGQVVFDSDKHICLKPQQRRCGYVFQTEALFPHMTVRENLEFAAGRYPRKEGHRRVHEIIEQFRLSGVAGRKPREVSGGQRQRCAVARALIIEPRVLLLDEPARGLDAPLRLELYSLLRHVRSQFQIPILLVTHDVDECFEIGDVMFVLEEGRIVQKGTPAAIAERPASAEVARLLGSINLFQAEIRALDPSKNSSRLKLDNLEIQGAYIPGHLIGDRIWIHLPPHSLRATPASGRPAKGQLALRLDSITQRPGSARLRFAAGITVDLPRPVPPASPDNEEWIVEIPPETIRVY